MSEETTLAAPAGGVEESYAEPFSVKTAIQMDLILGGDGPTVDQSDTPFKFTTERLWRDRPDVARAAIKLLAANVSGRSICRRLNLSAHTLAELRYRSVEKIAEQKELMRSVTFAGMALAFDKAIELLPAEKSAKDAAVVGGILGDKYLLFAGEPTARIEMTQKIDYRGMMEKLNEELNTKMREMKRAQVVEENYPQISQPISQISEGEDH